MYAVIKVGGKQYKVEQGQRLEVERLGAGDGDVSFTPVLVVDGETVVAKATDLTGGSNGFSSIHRPVLFGLDLTAASDLYVLVCVVSLLVGLLLWRVTTSTYGRALVGVRENERRMRALGYDTRRLKLSAFVLAGEN